VVEVPQKRGKKTFQKLKRELSGVIKSYKSFHYTTPSKSPQIKEGGRGHNGGGKVDVLGGFAQEKKKRSP